MKKRILSVIIAICLALSSCILMCGCENNHYDDAARGFQNAADSYKNAIERYS